MYAIVHVENRSYANIQMLSSKNEYFRSDTPVGGQTSTGPLVILHFYYLSYPQTHTHTHTHTHVHVHTLALVKEEEGGSVPTFTWIATQLTLSPPSLLPLFFFLLIPSPHLHRKEEVSNTSPLMVDVRLLKVCLPPLISEAHPQSFAVLHLHITSVQICGGPAQKLNIILPCILVTSLYLKHYI